MIVLANAEYGINGTHGNPKGLKGRFSVSSCQDLVDITMKLFLNDSFHEKYFWNSLKK